MRINTENTDIEINVSAAKHDRGNDYAANNSNFDSSNNLLDTSHSSNANSLNSESSDSFHSSDVSQIQDSISLSSDVQEDTLDDAQSDDFVTTAEELSVFYTNADNLVNKLDELKVRIQLRSFDVLVITEVYPKTGSSKDISDSELNIDGYRLYRSNVEEHSRGVVIYVANHISSNIMLELTNHSFSESVWVELRWNSNETFLLGGVYRSPQSSSENNTLLLDLINAT